MIELETIIDLYDEEEIEEDGKIIIETKLIKQDLISRRLTTLESLFPQEMFKQDGSVYEDRTKVYDSNTNEYYIVRKSYDELKKMILKIHKVGFR